jgi:hypothetical protein
MCRNQMAVIHRYIRLKIREMDLKWSNTTGHLVKVVKLPNEVKYDNREKTTQIHA